MNLVSRLELDKKYKEDKSEILRCCIDLIDEAVKKIRSLKPGLDCESFVMSLTGTAEKTASEVAGAKFRFMAAVCESVEKTLTQ